MYIVKKLTRREPIKALTHSYSVQKPHLSISWDDGLREWHTLLLTADHSLDLLVLSEH